MDTPIAVDLLIDPVCEEQHPNLQLVVVVVTTPDHHKFCIGFSPVDVRGRPLLDLSKTGGWRAAFFIFGMSILNKAHLSGTSLLLLREEDDFRFRVRVSSF
jgi:hypothetical protein